MMTMKQCLQNPGKLVHNSYRNFIAILTADRYIRDPAYITVIRRDGTKYGANPKYLTLVPIRDMINCNIQQ